MQQQLIINILGPSSLSALSTISASINQLNCNILDSRHAQYGTDFSLTMIVSGTGANVTLLEVALSKLCVELNLLCMMKRTSKHQKQNIGQYISLEFSGLDATGLLQKITQTIHESGISVHAFRQQTSENDNSTSINCKMILSSPKEIDLLEFDHTIKDLLNGLGLHGKIAHKPNDDQTQYVDIW